MSQLQVTGEAKIRDIQGPVVANSGVITALDGAASQYVRGDGTLADFPTSSGGGSSVSYYLNSSVSQGTIGGVAYRELSKEPIIGAGTDIAIAANGYVASYLTDANDPDVLSIPGGNFNCEFYFSVNNDTGNPFFYAELYKYDGTTFTLLGSSVGVPEYINQGTIIAPYYFAIPVPTSALALTDRLAIRIYVNVDGRTVTLHTENSHLCQVVTTLSKGMVSLNNLTDQSQYLTTGTSGTDFNIVSSGDTHTFNIPSASASNRGLITTGSQTIAGIKTLSVPSQFEQGLYLKQNMNLFQAGYIGLGASTTGLIVGLSGGGFGTLNFNNTTSFTYTFPNASGTLALTSDLSAYVPYTGATGDVFLGANSISGAISTFQQGVFNGNGTNPANLYLKKGSSPFFTNAANYGLIAAVSSSFILVSDVDGANYKYASFNLGSLTNNTNRAFTLPDLSGTLALLEGTQTFTGAKTFANNVKIDNGVDGNYIGFKQYGTGSTGTTGFTTLYSISTNGFGIGFGTTKAIQFDSASITTFRTYTFPDANGTLALTSDISYPVTSVFGRTGAVVAASGDYTTTQVTEGTNLYYTDARSRAALSFTAGSGAYNITTGVITIPTDNNQIANGAGYITSSALSGYLPLSGGTLTGGLNGTTATFSGLGTFYQLTMTGATAGRLFYAQTGGVFSQSGNLVWNNSTEQLGVGTPNPSAVVTAFSTNAATQLKAAGTAPAITFSNTLTSASLACVFGLATANNHFVTGTAPGDMAIANQSTSPGAIIFGTDTFEKMRMSSNGNFGIATSSPATKLDVSGTIRSISQTDPTSGVGMELFYRAADTSSYIQSYDRTNSAWRDVKIYGNTLYFGSQGTNNLTIASTGAATFSSSVTATSMNITSTSTDPVGLTITGGDEAFVKFMQGTGALKNWGIISSNLGVNDFGFYQSNSAGGDPFSAGTPKLYINGSGNVGIGTSSPSELLHLYKSSTVYQIIQTVSGGSGTVYRRSNSATPDWTIGHGAASANENFEVYTAGTGAFTWTMNGSERARITSAGKVLIGTTSVSAQLSVTGATSSDGITSTIVSTGNTAFVSNVPASSYSAYWVCGGNTAGYISHPSTTTTTYYTGPSDLKLKSNINEWNESVLDLFSKIKPKTYNHIADNDESIIYKGFIAQEMVDKFPEAYQKDRDGYYANNPTGFIPYLVKAIQELTQKVNELESKIK